LKIKTIHSIYISRAVLLLLMLTVMNDRAALAQEIEPEEGSRQIISVRDMADVFKSIFKKKSDTTKPKESSGVAILPSIGYNPSFGFVLGAKVAAGLQRGDTATTSYSTIGLEFLITSKGIITAQAIHNVFTKDNQFNIQGNWQLSRFGIVDYGVGTGSGSHNADGFVVNELPVVDADSSFPIKYTYVRLNEKIYRKVAPHWFAGGGITLNMYRNIEVGKQSDSFDTPHQKYSLSYGYNPEKYSANGLLLALQFNTREHPIRSYGGVYADVNIRFNQKWMGSTKQAVQFQYDLRKYFSLSKKSPEHVFALWHWASYLLSGSLPYLEMPTTGSDSYKRSGRAYTIGRFKGPSYAYAEMEYRFPITRDKLLSGVAFFNLQSASDEVGNGLYRAFDKGGGLGLRILFKKQSRSTLCIDFSKGQYGSSGIFFGLNEVF
jgi:hypothetical protein